MEMLIDGFFMDLLGDIYKKEMFILQIVHFPACDVKAAAKTDLSSSVSHLCSAVLQFMFIQLN